MLAHCDITYINLAHRTDRRAELENELDKLGVSCWTRFEAIQADPGALGCSMSHHALLDAYVLSKDLLMVLEDDCEFLVSRQELDDMIASFIWSDASVLCLAYNARRFSPLNRILQRVFNTQTCSAYVLKPGMIPVIKSVAADSAEMIRQGKRMDHAAIDRVWFREQERYTWAVPVVRAARQRESYSDIENKVVNYGL